MAIEKSAQTSDKTAQSRERADRRRAVLRAVRETRERLSSPRGTPPAFDYELALTYARNRMAASYALLLLTIVLATASLLWIDWRLATIWTLLVLAAHLVILLLCRRFI